MYIAIAFVRTGGGLAARARDFVGGGDHFVERGAHQLHRLTLPPRSFVHVLGDFAGVGRHILKVGRRVADASHKLSDHVQELVEPACQGGRFVFALHSELTGEVAFTFGDFLQTICNATNWPHNHAGETGAHDGEDHCQRGSNSGDQPGQT
ncbi:hypothetical protein D3C85_1445050 [compost metagenome]